MTDEIRTLIDTEIEALITHYNTVLTSLFDETNGGKIRGKKGALVEYLAKQLVELAWVKILQQPINRLVCNNEKQPIMISDSEAYILREEIDESERNRITNNFEDIIYEFGTDVHVMVDGELAIAIECKAYTETAMLKRIIFDSMLMDEALPEAKHCLLQLETAFSYDQYHVLMSHHTHNIDVITLLDGKRNSKKPIHRQSHFKELNKEKLINALDYFENVLRPKI